MKHVNPSTACAHALLSLCLFIALLNPLRSSGVQTDQEPRDYLQPDGATFRGRFIGDEFFHWVETLDHHPILQNADGVWVYALKGTDGSLVASKGVVGKDQPPDAWRPKLSLDTQKSRTDKWTRRKSAITSGTGFTPVILIDFSDLPAQAGNTASVFNQMLFGAGAGVKSMATYYSEVSGGKFTVAAGPGGVVGWYRAAHPSVYYGGNLGSGPGVNDSNVVALIREAVAAANAAGFNFAPYDQDGDGKVDVVNIIHAGSGEETGGGTTPNAIWSHRSSLGAQAVSYDGVTIDDYIIQPELSGPSGGLNTIGVFCHEYGHALGLPDLYDTDYTSNGVGTWSLMASGNYLDGGRTPGHMDAWCKWKLGWLTPTRYTFNAANVEIKNAEANASALFLWQNGVQGTEYFLVENRQLVGFDSYLPQAGLLIWHVDDTQNSNVNEWYPGHTSSGHYWVALEQADGKFDLELGTNNPTGNSNGDSGDVFSDLTGRPRFDSATTPNSYSYGGVNTGVGVRNIRTAGSSMFADIQVTNDTTIPSLTITSPGEGQPYLTSPIATGTASDNALKEIRVALIRISDGAWYNFASNAWGTSVFDFDRNVRLLSGSANWSTALPSLSDDQYEVHAQAVDWSDNATPWMPRGFTIDSSAPTITFSPLTNQQVVFNFDQLGGTISEAGTVKFKLEWFQPGGNQFWNGVNWSSDGSDANVLLAANVSSPNWSPAPGTLPGRSQIGPGNYLAHAYVSDSAGNSNYANIVLTRSPLDTTPPVVTVNIAEAEVFTNNFIPPIQGLAGDPESGVDLVTLYFMRLVPGGYEYWDGSSWSVDVAPITCQYHDGFWWELPVGFAQPGGGNLANGSYLVQVSARNREVPANTALISVNFAVDYHPTFTWTAGSFSDADPNNNNNDWGNPANWSPYGVPTADANVFIDGNPEARYLGSVTLNGLTLSGGTLYASNINVKLLTETAGRLHIENRVQLADGGLFKWFGGEFYGGGSKLGSLNNPITGTCLLSNTANKALYSATFNNSGTVRWLEGNLYGDESVINNGPTATWEASAAATMNLFPGFGAGHRTFNNFGTFRKLGASETLHQGYFTNGGTIELNAGLLTIYDSITWLDGSGATGPGTLRLINGCCGAFATVSGNVLLDSTLELNQNATYVRGEGNINTTSNGVLRLTVGFLGGNVNVSGAGQIVWDNGGFDGTNNVSATIDATGNLTKWFNRYGNGGFVVLNSSGIVNWSGGSIVGVGRGNYGEHPGTWNNSGTIRVLGDGTIFGRDGDYPTLRNSGTIVKLGGTNETVINSFSIDNYANITAQTGTLAFLDVFTLQTNSFLHGASLIRLAGSVTASNVVVASGHLRMDGGWFNAVTNTNGVALTAWLGTNDFNWLGGTFLGHHTFGPHVTVNITDPPGAGVTKYLGSATTIDNYGLVKWSGQAPISAWGRGNYGEFPSTFNNRPGATFALLNDGYPFRRDGDYSQFTNYAGALFVKTGGTNRSTIDSWIIANSGEVRADVGTNEFSDILVMQPGGRFAGVGTHLISAGTHAVYGTNWIDGTTVEHRGGTLTGNSNSVATLRTINSGLLRWTGGAIAERLAWGSGSTVEVAGSATKQFASGAVLDNSAYVRRLGIGNIWNQGRANYGELPGTWNNLSGAVFDAMEDSAFTYDGSPCTFVNLAGATFRKTGGTNTVVYWAMNNAGLVQASVGRIEFAGGGLGSTGTFLADAGARIKFTGGTYTLANAILSGAGQLQVDGATVTTVGNVTFNSPASLDVLSGTLNGFGNYVGNPIVNFTGGWLGGTQHIAPGSVFNISGSQTKYMASATVLNNEGTINWSGPGILYAWARGGYGEHPSTINNLAGGTFRFLTDGAPFTRDGDYSYLNNYGSIVKAGGTNETTLHNFIINNFGSIVSQTGTFAFVDYLNLGTNSQLVGQSPIRFAGSVTASNTVTASGTIVLNGGWFNAETNADGSAKGSWLGSGTLNWLGGTILGHHVFGSNATINVADPSGSSVTKYLGSLTTIDNYGQVSWSGAAPMSAWARAGYNEWPSTFNNMPGATFRMLNDGYPFNRNGDYSRFTNYAGAVFVKAGGTNQTRIDSWQFANSGEVRADIGTIDFIDILHLQNGGVLSGASTNLISAGSHTIQGTTTVNGTLRMSEGTLVGSNNATLTAGTGSFEWTGGWIGGEFTFGSGLVAKIAGTTTKAFSPASLIHNRGTVRWTESGEIWSPGRGNYNEPPMTFVNESGARFIVENDSSFTTWGSPHTFSNLLGAVFVKSNATATTMCNWIFNNAGTIDLHSGILALSTAPTLAPGAVVNVALGGTVAGTGYARLALAGAADLNGTVNVLLQDGFVPVLSNRFDVVTWASHNGQFSALNTPALPPGLLWNSTYGSTALTLSIGSVHSIVSPLVSGNGHFQFTLQGPAATRAVIEASEDLQAWTPIRTNEPFTGMFLIDDADAVAHAKRFYRVQIVP